MDAPEHYKNGQLKQDIVGGVRTVYFIDGTVKAQGPVADGLMDGEWIFNRKTGELWQVGHFKRGVQDGSWIRYHRDGSVEKDVQFVDGKQTRGDA